MAYIYYNLRLWIRQLERAPYVEGISLDGIATNSAWRVETERPIIESGPNWLVEGVAAAKEEEQQEAGSFGCSGGTGLGRVCQYSPLASSRILHLHLDVSHQADWWQGIPELADAQVPDECYGAAS